jgi:hypothetical protein
MRLKQGFYRLVQGCSKGRGRVEQGVSKDKAGYLVLERCIGRVFF